MSFVENQLNKIDEDRFKRSSAYKIAQENNVDSAILEGNQPDENAGLVKFKELDEHEKRIYLNDVIDFAKDLPRDIFVGLGKGGTNLAHIVNNVTNVLGINPDESYEFIQEKLNNQKQALMDMEKDSPLINKLISMLPQASMYSYPIYKKLNNAGIPKAKALIMGAVIGETLAFDKTETFFVDSKLMRGLKEAMDVPPDSSYEETFDKLVQLGEYSVYGPLLEKIFSGINTVRKLDATQGQQGTIAVGGGAAAGVGASQIQEATESEEKKNPKNDDQSMIPGTVNQYGFELTAGAVPVFKSILKEVASKQSDKVSGQQLFNTIKNTPGVKASELKWTGADDFMKENPNATKDELREYLRTNEFNVVETDFGANRYSAMFDELEQNIYDMDSDEVETLMRKYNFPGYRFDVDRYVEIQRDKSFLEDELSSFRSENHPTDGFRFTIGNDPEMQTTIQVPIAKFDEGVKRELDLIRDNTPFDAKLSAAEDFSEREIYYSPSEKTLSFDKGMDGQLVNNLEARNVEAVQTELSIRDLDDEIAELGDEFRVPRFGFYTLKGGEDYQVKTFSYKDEMVPAIKTSSIDIPGRPGGPIQTKEKADFAYRGGHFGVPGEFAHVRYKERNIEGKKTVFIEEMQSDLGQTLATYSKKFSNEAIDFPFKNTWYEIVFKRMIRDAADKGFDQIAIPSGVVAARRYGMDKNITSITARKGLEPGDDDVVISFSTGGSKVISLDEFEKLIPNETIKKDINNFYDGVMSATRGDNYTSVNQSNNVFLTLNLRNNIEIIDPDKKGKVELYDKAFPSFLKKYGKKWGSTVRVIDTTEEQMLRPYQLELDMDFAGKSPELPGSYIEGDQDIRPIQKLLDKRDFKIYVFEISPEMKKSVQEEGQSLFNIFGLAGAGGVGAKAVLDDKGNNTISNQTN